MPRPDNDEPLSVRHSLVVWLAGGIFGWVLAVVLIYGTIRATEHENIAREEDPAAAEESIAVDEQKLQDISPAAGAGTDDTTDE